MRDLKLVWNLIKCCVVVGFYFTVKAFGGNTEYIEEIMGELAYEQGRIRQ